MAAAPDEVGPWGIDFLRDFRYRTGLPLERYLINRRRRKEGKPPFR